MIITFTISHIIPADPVAFLLEKTQHLNKLKSCVLVMGSTSPSYSVNELSHWRDSRRFGYKHLHTAAYFRESIIKTTSNYELTFMAVLFSTLIGVPLGVFAAIYRNSFLDHFLEILTVSGLAFASFWLAILFQLLFAMGLQITPLQGRIEGWGPEAIWIFIVDSLIAADWESLQSALSRRYCQH